MKMKWKVMISAPYLKLELGRFLKWFDDHEIEIDVTEPVERMEEEDLLSVIEKYDGVVCGDDRFTETVYQKAKRLKVISKWGTGIDSIHKEIAERYGIKVYNTPDAFSHPVSDTVLAFMLAFSRNILPQDHHMKQGEWKKYRGKTLGEQTLGIIGCGNIGTRVARKAAAFGTRLLAADPRLIPKAILEEYGIEQTDMDTLLKESDFVSVNCDLNETSFHLFSEDEFKKMKRSAVLINTARGGIVDEAALVKALEQGEIAGCGLDVYEMEPLPEDSALRSMKQAILMPHNSNSSPVCWDRVHQSTLENLLRGLEGR